MRGLNDLRPTDVSGLLDPTIKASNVAFLSRSLHLTFQCPQVDGQMAFLERMAAIDAEWAGELHRRLDEALSEGTS